MHFSKHSIRKLRGLSELHLDRQEIVVGKHQLLAKLNRKQEARPPLAMSTADRLQLILLKVSRKLVPRYQVVVALALIVVLTTSTGIMAQAAVPGDLLWSVKLSFEKAEIAFAVDSVREGRLHLKHAENRLKELTVVVAQPEHLSKGKSISQLVRRLEKDITAADQSLKITKEERKDTQPQVIIALAKDLSDRATQAVKALQENKRYLTIANAPTITDEITGVLSTTTVPLIEEDSVAPTTTATTTDEETKANVQRNLKDVITEVQMINEYISYNALAAMIEMVERRGAHNRGEVTEFMRARIGEQRDRLASVQEAEVLINENFLLHRNRVRTLSSESDELLKKAEDAVVLDDLSTALYRLTEAKELITQAASLLAEVEQGNGFKPRETTATVKPAPTGKVNIQTVTGTSTEVIVPATESLESDH